MRTFEASTASFRTLDASSYAWDEGAVLTQCALTNASARGDIGVYVTVLAEAYLWKEGKHITCLNLPRLPPGSTYRI